MHPATVLSQLCLIVTVCFIGFSNAYTRGGRVGRHCQMPGGSDGICKLVHDCPEIMDQLKARINPVRESCGFRDTVEIVCCSNSQDNKIPKQGKESSPSTRFNQPNYHDLNRRPVIPQQYPVSNNHKRKSVKACEAYAENVPLSLGSKILAGKEAEPGEFPHVVAVGYKTDDEAGIVFDCSGTLITEKFVLTTAQCVIRKGYGTPSLVRVSVVNLDGKYDLKDVDYSVARVIPHPEYSPSQYYNDIALIELKKLVVFNGFVHPACLNTEPRDPSGLLTITGWGSTSSARNSKSLYLLKATVTSVPIAKCMSSFMNFYTKLPYGLADSQMCAGDRKHMADTCGGDGGGPLQAPYDDNIYTIFGIISFGHECGSGTPSGFTRVSSYLDWIESKVWP